MTSMQASQIELASRLSELFPLIEARLETLLMNLHKLGGLKKEEPDSDSSEPGIEEIGAPPTNQICGQIHYAISLECDDSSPQVSML